jgi:hypothetical protein
MNELQNPMTGIKNLEMQMQGGFRTSRVPFTENIHFIKDRALDYPRYTYVKLDKMNVEQLVTFNGNEPFDGLPCFCLFYGTKEHLRGKGKTVEFIKKIIELLTKELPRKYKHFYIETIVDNDNLPSLGVAKNLFGKPSDNGVDESTGKNTIIWRKKCSK